MEFEKKNLFKGLIIELGIYLLFLIVFNVYLIWNIWLFGENWEVDKLYYKKKKIIIIEYFKIYFIWSIEFFLIFVKRNNYINVNLVLKRSLKIINVINRYFMLKII